MADVKTPSRYLMRVELSPAARESFLKYCDHVGLTQVSVTSRIVECVVNQDEVVQAMILGHYPHRDQRRAAELILARMVGVKPSRLRKSVGDFLKDVE